MLQIDRFTYTIEANAVSITGYTTISTFRSIRNITKIAGPSQTETLVTDIYKTSDWVSQLDGTGNIRQIKLTVPSGTKYYNIRVFVQYIVGTSPVVTLT